MTDRRPSLMVPGEWESRRRSNVVPLVVAAPPGGESTRLAGDGDASLIPPDAPLAIEWPAWVRIAMGVGVLLAVMLLVMWGASSVVQ